MRQSNNLTINHSVDIRSAVKKMNEAGMGIAVIVDDAGSVLGIFTDGDFRRAVLNGLNLNESVLKIINRNFKYLSPGYRKEEILDIMEKGRFTYLPVLSDNRLVDLISKSDVVAGEVIPLPARSIPATVVIMAGGKGTRLAPFTHVLPKPLIPLGDKTMIEIVMDEYTKFGISDFYISVGHMAKMVKSYFECLETDYKINYIHEETPLGTCGALKYLEGKLDAPFFVSNCDIIIKTDYSRIFDYHKKGDFVLTMVTSIQRVVIPYGVCEVNAEGILNKINEKPEFDYLINTGMYVLNPDVLKFIPSDTMFNITDLIEKLLEMKLKVGVYPVPEHAYIDVGQWSEYKKAMSVLAI